MEGEGSGPDDDNVDVLHRRGLGSNLTKRICLTGKKIQSDCVSLRPQPRETAPTSRMQGAPFIPSCDSASCSSLFSVTVGLDHNSLPLIHSRFQFAELCIPNHNA
ncbi:hypothetical protein MLD38_009813 [Melastoma candidum]|uniref:Uncharacterized protein n=1 Tax=Melastoma candidum TaxID=119954 RepID=A0ACB9S0N4_9MYRT|nr:hypothetical protein MLD38_009813 [Melastoma candidum]